MIELRSLLLSSPYLLADFMGGRVVGDITISSGSGKGFRSESGLACGAAFYIYGNIKNCLIVLIET